MASVGNRLMSEHIVNRLNALTKKALDARCDDGARVEFNVSVFPQVNMVMAECGHPQPNVDLVAHLMVFYDNQTEEFHQIAQTSVLLSPDIIQDDETYMSWVDKAWDHIVIQNMEMALEEEDAHYHCHGHDDDDDDDIWEPDIY